LSRLDSAAYAALEAKAAALAAGLEAAFAGAGLPVQVPRVGPLVGLFFTGSPVRNYAEAKEADAKRYACFFHSMLERGVYLAPSAFEAFFVSLAHTPANLESTALLAAEAARDVAARAG
ncbi:MAG TPA: aspartate aminotransferase family protein, partial [Acidimicrobiia bacterium]|nr:aspartate aminotransferase family protein [Acidimicrobiia bacterium]